MKLTIRHRLAICFEVLTSRSGHRHPSQEKQLPVFRRGYDAGFRDGRLVGAEQAVRPVDVSGRYYDLLLCVGYKYPGETRHETARRYILEAERPSTCGPKGALP